MTNKDLTIEAMKAIPELTPLEIEEMLEWMEDNKLLSDKGVKLKNTFWKIFWKEE